VRVSYDFRSAPTASVSTQGTRPAAFPTEPPNTLVAFRRVEESGGREVRLAWERQRQSWQAQAVSLITEAGTAVNVSYFRPDTGERIQFLYEVRTNTVKRL